MISLEENVMHTTKIYWAGDSTVKRNDITTFPQTGIGQVIYVYLKQEVEVINYAENGRSTRTFIEEGRLDKINDEIKAGDFLFIQFGHNDGKINSERFTEAFGNYQTNLEKFIGVARNHGAYPVLITPLYRRHFDKNGKIEERVHDDYPTAMIQLADKLQVPCIDLCESSKSLLATVDAALSKKWFMNLMPGEYKNYPDGMEDNTHMQNEGAVVMAGLIAKGLRELGGSYEALLLDGLPGELQLS
jgi:lysophospholipase L1-like esterase